MDNAKNISGIEVVGMINLLMNRITQPAIIIDKRTNKILQGNDGFRRCFATADHFQDVIDDNDLSTLIDCSNGDKRSCLIKFTDNHKASDVTVIFNKGNLIIVSFKLPDSAIEQDGAKVASASCDGCESKVASLLYNNLMDAVIGFLWEADGDFKITFVSPSCQEVLGFPSEDLVGESLDLFIPCSKIEPLIASKSDTFKELEQGFYKSPVEICHLGSSGVIEYDDSGKVHRFFGQSIDITHHAEMRESLANAELALEQADKLNKINNFSDNSRTEAYLASMAKSNFLANVSHEIRTPLHIILGMMQVARGVEFTDEQADILEQIDYASQSLMLILNDILDYSNIEKGELSLHEQDFNIEEVVASAVNIIKTPAYEKGLEVTTSIQPNVPVNVIGDSLRLSRVLSNLVRNAVKFTSKGSVSLNVELFKESIEDNKIELKFVVKDTGIGISEDYLSQVFRPFSQADSSSTRAFGGIGLGLTLCKEIVELMGGRIWADSELNVGSTFYFTAQFTKSDKVEKQSTWAEMFSTVRLLVVDDVAVSLAVLEEQLNGMGITNVMMCSSGEEAVEAVEESIKMEMPFDLLLLDYDMPGMDGPATADAISRIDGADIPIVMMTKGYDRKSWQFLTGANEKITAVLHKPITHSTLHDAVVNTLFSDSANSIMSTTSGDYDTEESLFTGLRVLLAEDNPINQLVAKEVLHQIGCVVEVATNGVEAVELVKSHPFDIVFMDVQMPELDGFAATEAIRALGSYNALPIIAMTANFTESDREASRNAGMNGHVTKPITRKAVYKAIDNVLASALSAAEEGGESENDEPLKMPAIPSHADANAIQDSHWQPAPKKEVMFNNDKVILPDEIMGFDVADGLERVAGNRELYIIILHKVRDDIPALMQSLRDDVASGNLEGVQSTLHNLRGVLGNVSAKTAHEAGTRLQNAIKDSGSIDTKFLEDFETALAEVMDGLSSI